MLIVFATAPRFDSRPNSRVDSSLPRVLGLRWIDVGNTARLISIDFVFASQDVTKTGFLTVTNLKWPVVNAKNGQLTQEREYEATF